ncbi:MAG TPA: hypothetical protein VEV18_01465, partial [Steroidobacteraceae bacterium]|nr:hypothetical protein [Steroidobacteraceae bacterium]
LLRTETNDVLAVLPRELTASAAQRLGRYVLRSKVQISDETAAWRVIGITRSASSSTPPAVPSGHAARIASAPEQAGTVAERWIIATPHDGSVTPGAGGETAPSNADARRDWRLLDIAAGLPQVYASTSEQFVAQMLNLDVIDAISFSKGCYTGQEVIARAHYRGRIKRRMQRWRTLTAAVLTPGEAARLATGLAVRVVEAAMLPDGRSEFLAVAPLGGRSGGTTQEADDRAADAGASSTSAAAPNAGAPERVLDAEPLALPYELPD